MKPVLASLVLAASVGAALAALIEWWQTFAAFGRLPFPVTIESLAMVKAWTIAMTVAPLAVLASALLLAVSNVGRASARHVPASARHDGMRAGLKPGLHPVAVVATIILAARVWENVTGYLAPPNANANIEGTPTTFTHASPFVFAAVTIIAIAIAIFALSRTRPRLATLFIGAIAAIILIVAAGHLGFAPVAFLRLRNWTFVVALFDALAVVRWRKPEREDYVAWGLLAVVIACAVLNATAWQTMRISFPADVPIPAW